MNKPIQVYLDVADLQRLAAWADARGWTKSQAVRAAIRALTRAPSEDPVLDLSGDLEDLPDDLAARFDRYVNETYVAERPASYRPRRRPSRPAVRR